MENAVGRGLDLGDGCSTGFEFRGLVFDGEVGRTGTECRVGTETGTDTSTSTGTGIGTGIGAETWTVYTRQVKKLHAFMMRHLRSIMRITWMDKVTNKEILERTGLPSMEDLLIRKNLRWTGHLMRMSPNRLPKQVLYSQLSSGHRKRGPAPSSPIQGYHQKKPEDERHKDRHMDITLTAERQMESNSQVMEAVFVASRPTA